MYPDFIGIGAQKAGTTWLYRNLRAHPQIHMPHKEVHYFDRKIHDRSNALTRLLGKREADAQWRQHVKRALTRTIKKRAPKDVAWIYRYYMKSYDDDGWYASLFEPGKGEVAGEITPAYSALDRDGVARVHELMPEARIVFFMRNPIERVWSHAVMSFDKAQKASAGSVPDDELFRKLDPQEHEEAHGLPRDASELGSLLPRGSHLRRVPRGRTIPARGATKKPLRLPGG